jgi:hypothetical protein
MVDKENNNPEASQAKREKIYAEEAIKKRFLGEVFQLNIVPNGPSSPEDARL